MPSRSFRVRRGRTFPRRFPAGAPATRCSRHRFHGQKLAFKRQAGHRATDGVGNQNARIDGFTVKSATTGGGIVANGYTDYLQISNNRIANNNGFYGGGIRVGHPLLIDPASPAAVDVTLARAWDTGDLPGSAGRQTHRRRQGTSV